MPTKILAIDDSKTMRLAIKITFAAEDADVTSVSKGSEAVARAKQMEADVVLVDARLADGEPSGYDVCRALKSDAATSQIPVLVLVSSQTGVDQAELRACGADGFVAKPFDTQDMIEKVYGLLGKPVTVAPETALGRPASPASRLPTGRHAPVPTPSRSATAATSPAVPAMPAMKVASTPATTPRPAMATPAPKPSAAQPAAAQPAAADHASAEIPIAIPIPFTSADAPTAGILRRLAEAGGPAPGIDPHVAEALVALSREVIEQIVWEVVPDLAEEILKRQARSA